MAIERIDDQKLMTEGRYHVTQPDVPQKSSQEIKEFFDHVPREVIIPKVNEIVDGVNEALGLDGTGTDRNFITPAVDIQFYDGFYFNATPEMLTAEGLYSSGAEYHLMSVLLENGTVRPIYLRSNYSGSYSVHPEPWTWVTDILVDVNGSSYVSMINFGKVTITEVSELGLKYISLLPALDPSFKFASEQYVDARLTENYVTRMYKSGGWYCKEWNSGIKECWRSMEVNYESKAYGNTFADVQGLITTFPQGFFKELPAVFISGNGPKTGLPRPFVYAVDPVTMRIIIQTTEAMPGSVIVTLYCIGE